MANLHYTQVREDDEFIRSDVGFTHGDMFNFYGKAVVKFTAEDSQRVASGVSGGDVEMEAFFCTARD